MKLIFLLITILNAAVQDYYDHNEHFEQDDFQSKLQGF